MQLVKILGYSHLIIAVGAGVTAYISGLSLGLGGEVRESAILIGAFTGLGYTVQRFIKTRFRIRNYREGGQIMPKDKNKIYEDVHNYTKFKLVEMLIDKHLDKIAEAERLTPEIKSGKFTQDDFTARLNKLNPQDLNEIQSVHTK